MLCYYAECRILFTITLKVIMLSAIMLRVDMLSVVAPKSVPLYWHNKVSKHILIFTKNFEMFVNQIFKIQNLNLEMALNV